VCWRYGGIFYLLPGGMGSYDAWDQALIILNSSATQPILTALYSTYEKNFEVTMNTRLADRIYEAVQPLPEHYAQEALDFIQFLLKKAARKDGCDLTQAQEISMRNIWENEDDEVWNDVKPL